MYTPLPVTIKVLETFLEASLWKHFQLFRRILDVSRITKAPSLQCWFQLRKQVQARWSQVRSVWGMFKCWHIVLWEEILDQNHLVCWSSVVKEKPTVVSPFLGRFFLTASPRRRTNLWDRNFPHATTSGNYTSEFRAFCICNMKYRNSTITNTATMRNPQVTPMLHNSNVGLYIIYTQ